MHQPRSEDAGSAGATSSTPLLTVENVTKSFGAVAAVIDMSIELYSGEAHALVGENGAGKSTVVKMLGRHLFNLKYVMVLKTPYFSINI